VFALVVTLDPIEVTYLIVAVQTVTAATGLKTSVCLPFTSSAKMPLGDRDDHLGPAHALNENGTNTVAILDIEGLVFMNEVSKTSMTGFKSRFKAILADASRNLTTKLSCSQMVNILGCSLSLSKSTLVCTLTQFAYFDSRR